MTNPITRPGETWTLIDTVTGFPHIVIERPEGRVKVAQFLTDRDAACAVQGHNLLIEISALYQKTMNPHERDIMVQMALRRYGR